MNFVWCGVLFVMIFMTVYVWLKKRFVFKILLFSLIQRSKIKTVPRKKTNHIFVCIADHFEPGYAEASMELQRQRVDAWVNKFPELVKKHFDSGGNPPRHTWFFPPHYDLDEHLKKIVGLCKHGLGEIELHFHHNRVAPFPDTQETFTKKIENAIASYSRFGIFPFFEGKYRFCFVHGDWALDNSRGNKFCGINNEIQILSRLGCYADFTFPSLCGSQPDKFNSIYYAKDDPLKPKSYNTGADVKVGGKTDGDLMIIQGILGLRLTNRPRTLFVAVEDCDISNSNKPTKDRVDFWIRNGISVVGRPECKFIKIHTHGAWEGCMGALLGFSFDDMCSHLERKYNDGKNYKLYYVTSREMYNIIKAVESGRDNNFDDYRDFLIPKPFFI